MDTPNRFRFNEGTNLNEEEKLKILDFIESSKLFLIMDKIQNEPPKYIQAHANTFSSTLEMWIKNTFHLNVSDRATGRKRIRGLLKSVHSTIFETLGLSGDYPGGNVVQSNEVILNLDPSEEEILHTLRHELVHSYSYRSLSPTKKIVNGESIFSYIINKYGYSQVPVVADKMNPLTFFNECITEIINQKVTEYMNEINGSDKSNPHISYVNEILILEALIKTTSRNLYISENAILSSLIKGYFDGSTDGLRLLTQGLSKDVMQFLSRLRPKTCDKKCVNSLAPYLDKEALIKKAEDFFSGKPTTIFGIEYTKQN